MDLLSDSQNEALLHAHQLLLTAGLTGDQIRNVLCTVESSEQTTWQSPAVSLNYPSPSFSENPSFTSTMHPVVRGLSYLAPPAEKWSPAASWSNRINRQTQINAFVDHPKDVVLEYPQTGNCKDECIAHRFTIDPHNFGVCDPRASFQYSLGDSRSGSEDVTCGTLLVDSNGLPVSCFQRRASCKGVKSCSAGSAVLVNSCDRVPTNHQLVFEKTLSFYCALWQQGCGFHYGLDTYDSADFDDSDFTDSMKTDSRRASPADYRKCSGRMILQYDKDNKPYIKCSQSSVDSLGGHLYLTNLDEFNTEYLQALLENDTAKIQIHEASAAQHGYGPCAPCSFTASATYWHRSSPGSELQHGNLTRTSRCTAEFIAYIPYDLVACSQVVVICKGPHSHPKPSPVKIPPPVRELLRSLLISLDWKLADATPRKILLDSGFTSALRTSLGWKQTFDPSLSDLHPSLGNSDRVRRIINSLRQEYYASGTGFEGAKQLVEDNIHLPHSEQYVRCAESHTIENGKTLHLVICMFPEMSKRLMNAKYISIDTSFKRLNSWQEFEMESWDHHNMKSVVSARAFFNSQSAEAHVILFTRIFKIAFEDTGIPVRFRHIHGEGFESWIADGHKGQALGVGRFCEMLCRNLDGFCPLEPHRLLRDLNAYDHLKRFYRLCITHYKRNIHEIRAHVSSDVRKAMISLASSQPLPDLNATLAVIENGGTKAKAWLDNKIVSSKFALPAIYQPLSLIPLDVWKASPSTTNGNEQSHWSINQDGEGLTMLGGIMRGREYDHRAMKALQLYEDQNIFHRDQTSTDFRRSVYSINRKSAVQRRIHQESTTLGPRTSEKETRPLYTTVPLFQSTA